MRSRFEALAVPLAFLLPRLFGLLCWSATSTDQEKPERFFPRPFPFFAAQWCLVGGHRTEETCLVGIGGIASNTRVLDERCRSLGRF
jgi:hypothetical protein